VQDLTPWPAVEQFAEFIKTDVGKWNKLVP
jgi:hypothetical protein